jgi:GTP-binding protein HflX
VRQVRTTDGGSYTVTNRVGFVRHLPDQLVDALRSTFEEVARSDLVLHIVDAFSPQAAEHIATVRGVLRDSGAQTSRKAPRASLLTGPGLAGAGYE